MSDEKVDHELQLSLELNSKFESLSDVQRIEIRRRFDKALSIGISAHKIFNDIESGKREMAKLSKSIWASLVICVVLYGAYGLARSFNGDLSQIWLVGVIFVLIYPLLNMGILLAAIVRNNNKKSQLRRLDEQWISCTSNLSLRDFINLRLSENLDAAELGKFRMSTLRLKSSIIDLISFQYAFA